MKHLNGFILLALFYPAFCLSEPLRIASYNVKCLNACVNSVREDSLRSTLADLDADILALQEIKDRRALEYFFPPALWNIIIDDESSDDQNLAYVIKKNVSYRLLSGSTSNAEPEDFLFTASTNFPDRRDVLRIYVAVQELNGEVELLNHHAKSRYNGRITSEAKRLGAALEISSYIDTLSQQFVLLLGEFNDNPDDASLNTLRKWYSNASVHGGSSWREHGESC